MSTSSSRKDPCWQYVRLETPSNTNNTICIFCEQRCTGGICRAKQHIVGGYANVRPCDKVPDEVKKVISDYMDGKKKAKEQVILEKDTQNRIRMEENTNVFGDDDGEEDEDDGHLNKKTKFSKKGPMDLFVSHSKTNARDMKKQKEVNEGVRKEMRNRACSAFAQWMYDASIAFNAVKYDSFQTWIQLVSEYGPGMKAPSYHEVRVPLLKKEVDQVNRTMDDHKAEWKKHGCSIMSDGWKDNRERQYVNFLVNCPKGSMFIKTIDASDFSKTGEKIFQVLDEFVKYVGEENVVQVVTDNATNMKLVGRFFEAKYPHLFWTPCAAHCIDLMLEDMFKQKEIHDAYIKAVRMGSYIYARSSLVTLMRKFTKLDLIRVGPTRFATATLTLSRMHKLKKELRALFVSESWTSSSWAREPKGIQTAKTVLSKRFWKNVLKALKCSCPIYKVLRLVDGEVKPTMGYIYEAIDRAKEAIAKSFQNDEDKYKRYFEIIDARWEIQLHHPLHAAGHFLNPEYFYKNPNIENDKEVMDGFLKTLERLVPDSHIQDLISDELSYYRDVAGTLGFNMAKRQRNTKQPAEWWKCYGGSTPHLKDFAIKVLSLTCSSSGCERNWSVFEHVHNKKRNRLAQKKLNDLIYVKYNRALRRRLNQKDMIEGLSLDNIDESSEWLVGLGVGEDDMDSEMFDENLSWRDISLASGAEEPTYNTRVRSFSSRPPLDSNVSTSRPSSSRNNLTAIRQLFDEVEKNGDLNVDEDEDEGEPPIDANEEDDFDFDVDEGDDY